VSSKLSNTKKRRRFKTRLMFASPDVPTITFNMPAGYSKAP
jgi:hypothetical protein